jgi:hypothetical protein
MAKAGTPSVDDYLARQPDEARKTLRKVRAAIGKALRARQERQERRPVTHVLAAQVAGVA